MTIGPSTTPIYAFAVPALLMRSFKLAAPQHATITQHNAEAEGFTIIVDLFSFANAADRAKAAAAFTRAAKKSGKQLKKTACMIEEAAFDLYISAVSSASLRSPNEKGDLEVYANLTKEYVDTDFRHTEHFSQFVGFPMVYFHSQHFVNPPFPPSADGTVYLFGAARPPGMIESKTLSVKEVFGLPIFKYEEARRINAPSPGRGRIIEQSGMSVFQVLGRNYYQICLLPDEAHDFSNRERVFVKLLGVLYQDLLTHQGPDQTQPDATSEELAEFGENQIQKMVTGIQSQKVILDGKIGKAEHELFELYRDREAVLKSLKAWGAADFMTELRERLPTECAEIKSINGVSAVRLIDDAIHVETKSIIITHNGLPYDLGPFVIRLYETSRVMVWSDEPRHPKGHHHPHIDRKHLACFGSATLAIAKFMAAFRFADTTRLVIRWLNTYNPDSTLTPIEDWPMFTSNEPQGDENDGI